jgi:hypothetical protein
MHLHLSPREIEDLPEETYQLYKAFLRTERQAGRLKQLQQAFYR